MNNYSLGSMDPELIRQVTSYVQPSAYQQMDPQTQQRVTGVLDRLSGGGELLPAVTPDGDWAHGVASPTHEGGDDMLGKAFQIAGGVLTSPLRLLGGAFHAFEGAIGHPNAMRRDAAQTADEIGWRQLLLDKTMSPQQKAAYGATPEELQWAQQVIALPTTAGGDSERAYGRDLTSIPRPPTHTPGLFELITGQDSRDRAERMGQMAQYQRDLMNRKEQAAIEAEQARTRASDMNTWADSERGKGEWLKNDLLGRYGTREEEAKLAALELAPQYTRAQIDNLYADNRRADATASRLAAGDPDKTAAAALRLQTLQERLRGLKIANDSKASTQGLGPYGENTGYDSLGLPFDINKADAALRAANTPEERATILQRYGVGENTTGGVDLPYVGNIGGTKSVDWNSARLRNPKQTDQSVAAGVNNNPPASDSSGPTQGSPQFAKYYQMVKGSPKAAGKTEAEITAAALELMRRDGVR